MTSIDSDGRVKNWDWLVLTKILVSIDRRRCFVYGRWLADLGESCEQLGRSWYF